MRDENRLSGVLVHQADEKLNSRDSCYCCCEYYFLRNLTLSSAAVCKLFFCGILLRSKTTKERLTNCRAHEVCGAGAPCYALNSLVISSCATA